jgi:quercetin dioxygenase-like cupin family protein
LGSFSTQYSTFNQPASFSKQLQPLQQLQQIQSINMAPLPPPRIVIASHNEEGKSVFSRDTEAPLFGPFGPNSGQFTTLFTTDSEPASNTAELPSLITTTIPRPGPKGSYFGTSDMPPGAESPFHRTVTVDYMVVLKGEIVARLDDGVEKTIKEGEMMVQMGTIHSWLNKSDKWCRMLFVMLPAEKVVMKDGKVLDEAFFPVKHAGV